MAGAVNFRFADDDQHAFFAAPASDGQLHVRHGFGEEEKACVSLGL
jgi:hypothetical protein